MIDNYTIRNRKDRNKHGGGVKNGVICKQIKDFEFQDQKVLSTELTIRKKKWIIFNIYRPPSSNLIDFFEQLEISLNKAFSNYDKIILMGDINIDTHDSNSSGYDR